jgi:hypothetical protein
MSQGTYNEKAAKSAASISPTLSGERWTMLSFALRTAQRPSQHGASSVQPHARCASIPMRPEHKTLEI